MSLQLLSKHKTKIMAVAMLWVAVFHANFDFRFKPIRFLLSTCGYCGVDLFMIMSGFGIYYSLKKNPGYWTFIKKRIRRLLPYSTIFYFFQYIFEGRFFLEFLYDSLGITIFYRKDLVNWYTSFILFVYLITPLIYKFFKKYPLITTLTISISLYILCNMVNNPTFTYIYFRLAIYMVGMYLGYLNDKLKDTKKIALVLSLLTFAGWALMFYMYHYLRNDVAHVYPMIIAAPGMALIIAYVVDKIKFTHKALDFIGRYTFQYYLLHASFVNFLYRNYMTFYIPVKGFDFYFNVFNVIVAFFMAMLLKWFGDQLLKLIDLTKDKLCLKKN